MLKKITNNFILGFTCIFGGAAIILIVGTIISSIVSIIILAIKSPASRVTLLAILSIVPLYFAIQKVRQKWVGYWIETVSRGVLRGGEHDWAAIYYERGHKLWFDGDRDEDGQDCIFAPTEDEWNSEIEPWAKNRRTIILKRLERAYPERPIRKRMRRYWIKHIPRLSGNPGWGVLYHEGGNEMMFTSYYDTQDGVDYLYAPSEEAWTELLEPSAPDQRQVILERIQRQYPNNPIRPFSKDTKR